ncbi:hypothetical protein OAJ42_01255 [Flavobacteriales bacterium]|nr:hypothetical protein [Flavobacteriales bacterium]
MGFGQGWYSSYDISQESKLPFKIVQQTSDDGYIVTGSYSGGIYLLKTNQNGDSLWYKSFYENFFQRGSYSVEQTHDDGYIMTGWKIESEDEPRDCWIMKTDSVGNQEWFKEYVGVNGSCSGLSVLQTYDEDYYVFSGVSVINPESQPPTLNVILIKTDSIGNQEWYKTFGDTINLGRSVKETVDNGYVIFGEGRISQKIESYIIKTNENGEIVEEEGGFESYYISDNYESRIFSGEQTSDEGYVMCGETTVEDGDDYILNLRVIKIFEDGDIDWIYDDPDKTGKSIQQTSDGKYIVGGKKDGYIYVVKLFNDGSYEWSQTLDVYIPGLTVDIKETSDLGYIVCGGNYLIKMDSEGNVTSTIELPTPTSKRELIKTTNILGQENTTIKNQPFIELYDDGSTEKKIVLE